MSEVRTVVASVLRIDASAVTDDTAMRTTPEWDSLAHMEMVAAIEAAFGVQLTMDEIVTMATVAGMRTVLRAHGKVD